MKPLCSILIFSLAAVFSASSQTFNSQNRDIGAVGAPGSASSDNGTFTIHGSGEDIWGTADEFHFVYVQLSGDMQIVARVTDVEFTDAWAKAGLMARETLDANSRNFMVFITAAATSGVQWRTTTGGDSSYLPGYAGAVPHWLKLVRTGNTLSGYRSPDDGLTWVPIGSTTISLPSSLYVGMAVTSHHDGTLCTAIFDNVTQSSTGGGGGGGGGGLPPTAPTDIQATAVSPTSIRLSWTDTATNEAGFRVERSDDRGFSFHTIASLPANSSSYVDVGLSPSTRYSYRLWTTNSFGSSSASNGAEATTPPSSTPAGWNDQDIGAVSVAGSFSQSGNNFTVSGSGYDIWDNNDEFHYASQTVSSDAQIVARITGMSNTSPWAKAGVMIRNSLTPNAANVLLALTPSHGLALQWRSVEGGQTSYIDAGAFSAPVWVKLVKTADTVTAYVAAPPGANWTAIGSVTVNMPNSPYGITAGLAVTSHYDGTLCTATFDNVTITGAIGGGGPTAPAAPIGLNVAGVSSNFVSLTWEDTNTNEMAFRIERSTDGVNFQAVATLPWGSPYYNSYSYVDSGLSPGTHYWYRVFASNNVGSSPPSNVAEATTRGTTLWRHQDIGNVSAAGNFSQSGGTLTVGGSGSDIWGNADELHYAYQNGTNDAQIVARVTDMSNTSPWAKAGVMIRASVAAGSQHVILVLTPGNGLAFQWRSNTDGPSSYVNAGAASAPVWVKLVKSGNTFTGYRSADGVNWTQVGSVNIAMPSAALLVGLAVTSDNDGIICLANFDNVTISSDGGGGANLPAAPSGLTATASASDRISLTWQDNSANETGFILERSTNGTSFIQIGIFPANNQTAVEAVVPGSHYWYRVAATNSFGVSPYSNIADATTPTTPTGLPAPWQDRDIGTSGGSASYTNGIFYVVGSGADIYGNSDQFNFAYQPVTGDTTIIAAIDRLDLISGSIDPWARIGLMIRETLDPNSKNAMVFVSHEHGTGFTTRESTGGNTQYVPGNSFARFLKLTRSGNIVSAYWSPDDHSWQLIGTATINMANNAYVGLAVTSHSNGSKVAGQFSQVSVTSGGGGGGGSLPSGWQNQDIGPVALSGSASFSQGTFTIKGDGADIWGTTDAFHYVYQTIVGNGELVARLTALQNTEPWAKAGLMFREYLNYASPNAFVMATADHGTGFQWRGVQTGGSSYVSGPFYTAPVWLKLKRQGFLITASTSLDGTNWSVIGSQGIPLSSPMLMGLAVTSHNNAALNTSMFDNVTWTPSQ